MFELLCRRVYFAEKWSLQTAARMPLTLLAASDIPIPVPQTKIPIWFSPSATLFATGKAISG
jgi:hypothetical protein